MSVPRSQLSRTPFRLQRRNYAQIALAFPPKQNDAIMSLEEYPYVAKNEKTSKRVATEASKILRSKTASKIAKSVAGSALTQAPDHKSAPKRTVAKRRSK
jgi:hypothetical protein